MIDRLVILVHEDVVAGQVQQKTLDGVTDGLQVFPFNVMMFVLGAPKYSSLETLVHNRLPSVASVVRV
jgi:hypothetical protein